MHGGKTDVHICNTPLASNFPSLRTLDVQGLPHSTVLPRESRSPSAGRWGSIVKSP